MTTSARRVTTKVIATSRTVRLKRAAIATLTSTKAPTASASARPVPSAPPGASRVPHSSTSVAHEAAS